MHRFLVPPAAVLLLSVVAGCASVPAEDRHPSDPFERYNRAVFAFNDGLDRAVLKPAAEAYQELPQPVRTGVGNFFSNLDDVVVLFNNVLQAKFHNAASDVSRLMFNTTFGVFGLFDVASPMGLAKNNEDFGQTLGYWGVPAGPYLQVPFLGPSTVRDAPARVVDVYTHPGRLVYSDHPDTVLALAALDLVHVRAGLLSTEDVLATISDDRYVALRDFWLQRREFLVRDGEMANDDAWLDELDALEELEALEAMEREDPPE
ncbi:VacJ-like lipoprotein precursor [Thioalkalivibrio nitratireducens DSM 14787]|uniref:VacJ-like lipoprotein n=1 Tax=Thioalkalivibrio nitratireducens (strain DSM 14787 / UNIQEM 213 / ALEN2) TaxID=1255043 RepID=L0E0W5_THIND|nr:VacJ-like lipoprotein precursor [Thioalkalivibrio nitratireducens DSM 14787]